ncbi:MAG: phosphoenolpyruvate-utilizing N-terminal domain-containing protein, partial [bacterium]
MLKGIAASRGIAIGKAVVLEEAWDACVLPRTVSISEVKAEVTRFEAALRMAEADVRETEHRLEQRMGRKYAHLFEAYALILQDPMLRDEVIRLIERERVNAEGALSQVVEKLHRTFSEMEDAYLRDRGRDVLDAGRKILEHLVGAPRIPLEQMTEASIVIAHNLTPADTVALREAHVLAFATDIGGRDSHTAILAQSLEIPAVVGLRDVTSRIKNGTLVIVDGNQGLLVVDPDARTIEAYRREQG